MNARDNIRVTGNLSVGERQALFHLAVQQRRSLADQIGYAISQHLQKHGYTPEPDGSWLPPAVRVAG